MKEVTVCMTLVYIVTWLLCTQLRYGENVTYEKSILFLGEGEGEGEKRLA